MSQPEGEGVQSGAADGTQSGTVDPTTGTGTPDPTTSTDGTQSGANPGEADRLAETYRTRMQAADRRAAQFEAELKQLRDKDLPEQDKLKRDYEDAIKKNEDLAASNKELALKTAFLEDNSYKWQNPKRALQLVDLSQVEIQADGTVSGLKDALKALATSDPYLLVTEAVPPKNEPGGTAPGNNGGTGGQRPNGKAMAARIPALQTRVKRS